MAAKRGRTTHRLELGIQMRQLRENCGMGADGGGLSPEEAVVGLRLSAEALKRVEAGELNFRNMGDLRALLDRYGVVDDRLIDGLVALNKDSTPQDYWVSQIRGLMPTGMPGFVGLEPRARSMKAYHPSLVHGLLQTPAYARAHHEAARAVDEHSPESIERSLALRSERQKVLTREKQPLRLHTILGEAALRYPAGGANVMREQYARITEVSQWDHVTVQVLPFRPSYRTTYDFAILDFGRDFPLRVETDSAWGTIVSTEMPREVDRFIRRFDSMVASALPPEDTPGFLHRLEREL